MTRRIRVLDEDTVNKIAAGEAVESPSSVVKELLENSLDASARNLRLAIDGGGTRRISLTDDGVGMSQEDAKIAFLRHSTSKIRDISDLGRLTTLGFRGEALASISAVSNVELITRERGSLEGTRIMVSGGKVLAMESVGCPEGTTVTVTSLFENVPARKKFLKGEASERARCLDVATRLLMMRPEVGFRIEVDGEERTNSPATADHRERIAHILGPKTARSLIEIPERGCGPVIVRGYTSLPWETRSNSGGITISVGRRVVKNRPLVEAVRRGYGSRLMKGRYPLAVIDISISPGRLDVNVHPSKDLVKFGNEEEVLACIEGAVSSALFSSARKAFVEKRKAPDTDMGPAEEGPLTPPKRPLVKPTSKQERIFEGEVRPQASDVGHWSEVPMIEGMERLPPALPENAAGMEVRIIGQLDRSYILCEINGDLLLVDQHASHERVRMEALKTKYSKGGASVQELLDPVHIELDERSITNLESMGKELRGMGFLFERFGAGVVVVRGLPMFLGRMEGHDVLKDLATGSELHDGCSPPDPSFSPELPLKERVIALSACKGAIKAHHQLSLKEMEELITSLLKCEVPLHCAHGRPTMVRLPLSVLERWFKRVL